MSSCSSRRPASTGRHRRPRSSARRNDRPKSWSGSMIDPSAHSFQDLTNIIRGPGMARSRRTAVATADSKMSGSGRCSRTPRDPERGVLSKPGTTQGCCRTSAGRPESKPVGVGFVVEVGSRALVQRYAGEASLQFVPPGWRGRVPHRRVERVTGLPHPGAVSVADPRSAAAPRRTPRRPAAASGPPTTCPRTAAWCATPDAGRR